MSKTKKKLTKEEKLAKDRLRKRLKYQEIKNNPELLKIKQERDRKNYILRKEQKKIRSITEISARAQREQRKRWRKNSLKYKKKKREQNKETLVNDTPEVLELEKINVRPDTSDKSTTPRLKKELRNKISATPSSSNRKFRYRVSKTISRLQNEIDKLKKEKRNLQIKLKKNQEVRQKSIEDTVEKNVNKVIQEINSGKIEEVKKRLIFNETFTHQIKLNYKKLDKTDKRSFAEIIVRPNDARLRKHKIITKVPFTIRQNLKKQENKNKALIQLFFEDDSNSRMASGKKEYIKRGNNKKQKRYLNDNLKNLHQKFCKEHSMISYTVFCKNRPYWIVFPKDNRDTCQCKLHSNVNLLIKALKKSNIISENSATDVLNSLCCDSYNENCLGRSCANYGGKSLVYREFDDSEEIDYFQWINEKQNYILKDGQKRVKKVTTKSKTKDKPRNIIIMLESLLKIFFDHVRNIVIQYQAISELKKNLKNTEVLIHVDFSENYCLKYHEEIQSYHFGGSRGQVSLHTVVLYYMDGDKISTKSICTMSQCINHDASAIWAHITPILERAKQLVPSLTRIHFLSDSPSSQYRNRFIFYMIIKIHLQILGIEIVTWNFQEAGHGKGAPDGVGAVIKRTADSHVKFGGDVGSFEDFVNLLSRKLENVEITVISEEDIIRKKFPSIVPSFRGTTKVHQVLWSSELPFTVALRCLSCFTCLNSYLPCEHQKHLGMLDMGFGQSTTTSIAIDLPNYSLNSLQPEILNIDTEKTQNEDPAAFDIDSDTLCNNIEVESMFLNEFDGTLISNEVTLLEPISSDLLVEKEKPKIISNIPFDYQSFKAQLSSTSQEVNKRKTEHQLDIEQFAKSIKLQRVKLNQISTEESYIGETEDYNNKENIMKNIMNDNINLKYYLDDWVVVKYRITEKRPHFIHYVGKIIDIMYDTHEYKMFFLKKSCGKSMTFVWPPIKDEDIVPESRIIQKLNQPHMSRRGQYIFDDLPNINYK